MGEAKRQEGSIVWCTTMLHFAVIPRTVRRLEKSRRKRRCERVFSSCAAMTRWENKSLRKPAGALRDEDEEQQQDARGIMAIALTHSTWVWCLPMYQALVVITTFLSERTRSRQRPLTNVLLAENEDELWIHSGERWLFALTTRCFSNI